MFKANVHRNLWQNKVGGIAMETTVLKEIVAFLVGRKYYANIVATKGTAEMQICSYIFRNKADAEKHRDEIFSTLSFQYIETISFRSRRIY